MQAQALERRRETASAPVAPDHRQPVLDSAVRVPAETGEPDDVVAGEGEERPFRQARVVPESQSSSVIVTGVYTAMSA